MIVDFINRFSDDSSRLLCFKLMVDQFLDLRMDLALNDFFDLSVIKIIRDNFLEVVVSRVRSSVNNIVHINGYVDASFKMVHLDPVKIINQLNDVKYANELIRDNFLDSNCLVINYSEILNNISLCISDIYKFLGVDSTFIPSLNLIKIGSTNVWDDISNSDEIFNVLKNSEFNYLI